MADSNRAVLVVGGTGPTGPCIVNRLLAEGRDVTIYHSGRHEVEFDRPVEHLHGDPRDPADIAAVLGDRHWDIAVLTSGRLKALAETLAGRCRRLVGITGQPVYRGTMAPTPGGRLPLPVPEWAERQRDRADYTGKVAEGEDQLMLQHGRGDFEATVVRYPGVYGPRCILAHEWAIVKRLIDGRRAMVMPGAGMAYFQRGFVENLGQMVYLAATRPEASGQFFNAGDERVLSARHVAEIVSAELNLPLECVDIPAHWCRGFYPLAQKSSLVLDSAKSRSLLGYRDVVDVADATARTARWLWENRPADVSPAFGGSFDYDREDAIISAWRELSVAAEERLGLGKD
ncbi:MAG: NAD-dependent epimerase/dehydratase family protein [Dehalococcoidia bacterium]